MPDMNELGPLLALMREVTGPQVSDGKLTVLVTLVASFMGRKGGRPRKPDAHQIDVAKPVTPETETRYETSIHGGFGGSFSESDPGSLPDSSKPKTKRRYNSMSLPGGFNEFWALYPRRVCKAAAIKAWGNINPDINLMSTMMSALRWQADNVFARREIEKVPHPATWLNGRRWEDEQQTSLPNGHNSPRPTRPL